MKPNKEALIIFIKNPQKGKVKTRLARTVGDEKALKIYKALLDHTRKIALALSLNRFLFYSDYINYNDCWSNQSFKKHLQISADLGAKMATAFQRVLLSNEKAVIIGSDCATLTKEIIEEAFRRLDDFPFVVGPAIDGGYYLLGMKKYTSSIFENIEWSTPTVLSTTIQRIQSLGETYYLLPELSDIDHEEDWKKYGWQV